MAPTPLLIAPRTPYYLNITALQPLWDYPYGTKIVITMQEMMKQMDISDKTLHRMIEDGDLPNFTYGSKWSKKKGWHTAVLERHAMEKYEKSNSYKNVSDAV